MIHSERQEIFRWSLGWALRLGSDIGTPVRLGLIALPLFLATSPWLRAGAIDNQPPTTPGEVRANDVGASGFTVSWSAASDNVKVTEYEVLDDNRHMGTATGLTKTFDDLAPNTRFVISVRARDAKGNWSPASAPLNVTTSSDITPPTVPTGLSVDAISLKGFALSWLPSTDDVKVSAYEVFSNGLSLGASAARSRMINGLNPGTSYRIEVRARDAAGNWSALSDPITATTERDTTAPSVPQKLGTRAVVATRMLLKWEPSRDDIRVAGYEVSKNDVSLGVSPGVSRRIIDLSPSTTYLLRVRACDESGNWSRWSDALNATTAADTSKPSTPKALTAVAVTSDAFLLSWSPATDNVGVAGYDISRSGVIIGTSLVAPFRVEGLSANSTYSMRVRSRDAAGNTSAWSAELKVTTAAAISQPPTVPTGLASGDITSSGFTLTWTPSTGAGAITYDVYLNGAKVGTTSLATFTFTGLAVGGTYRAAVMATDDAGRSSALSGELSVTLQAAAFMGGFETTEGYTLGALQNQNDWTVTGSATVVAAPTHLGEQALSIPAGASTSFATHSYPSSAGVTFIDFFAMPAAGISADTGVFFETEGTAVALMGVAGTGLLQAFDGNGHDGGSWLSTGAGVPLASSGVVSEWMRVTIRSDAVARKWDLFLNGKLVATDLGFATDASGATGVLTFGGQSANATVFDDVLVSGENPIGSDLDRDGMDDAWESAHNLDPNLDDRHSDFDGDGVDNIHENLFGLDPSRADTDGDGIPDQWELAHGLDPRAAADGARDDDGDGLSNFQEWQAGSNLADFFNGRAFTIGEGMASTGTTYSYDLSGRLTRARTTFGRSTEFTYDRAGNLLRVSGSGPDPIVDWRVAHGLPADGSGVGGDGEIVAGDGLPNLAKYAFGLDPYLPFLDDCPLISRTLSGGMTYLSLTYSRPNPAPADLRYTVEVSADGTTWNSGPGWTVSSESASAGNFATVTTQDTAASNTNLSGFPRRIRLRIERISQL